MGQRPYASFTKEQKRKCVEAQRRYREKYPERVAAYAALESTKEQRRETRRRYCKRHAEEIYAYNRKRALRVKYGMSEEGLAAMLEVQQHKCKICRRSLRKGRTGYHVDHCHKRGVVRGILCSQCNTGPGMFGESSEVLSAAANYLSATPLVEKVG